MRSLPGVTVVAMAGHLDSDLVPHFLSHYRTLGVSRFRFALHGDFARDCRDDLERQPDVEIVAEVYGLFTEGSKVEKINWMLHGLAGQWVMMCDLDEFIELPADSLADTIAAMEQMGIASLPAFLVQRMASDGSLPELEAHHDIESRFPLYSFNLAERLGTKYPPIKTKFPLCKVPEDYSARDGFHYPLLEEAAAQKPLRATLSHFKWRKNLLKSVRAHRGKDANDKEMAAYRDYLDDRSTVLPLEGSRPYDREDLIDRGLLVPVDFDRRPRVKTASQPSGTKLRICLVSREVTGPFVIGGVGTATSAMAENLVSRGHDVTILHVPYEPWFTLDRFWVDGWRASGVNLIQLDLEDRQRNRLGYQPLMDRVLEHLEREQYDIAHFDDAHALGASACQLRASGLGLAKTALVMTTHGCSYWHSAGGTMPRSRMLNRYHFSFEQQTRLADLVIHPSGYMKDWVSSEVHAPRDEVVIPNVLPGFSRSFFASERARRMPDEIVFFGRIEPRKGWSTFLLAVEELTRRGRTVPKITLLGRIGESLSERSVGEALAAVAGEVSLETNFRGTDAINYLKAHDCLVVIPSLRDNLPYTVYECLENGIPMICSDVGGIRDLVDERDWSRTAVASDPVLTADAITEALDAGWVPARLAFDPDEVADRQVDTFEALHVAAQESATNTPAPPPALALCFAEAGMSVPDERSSALRAASGQMLRVIDDLALHRRSFGEVVAWMNSLIAEAQEEHVLLCCRSVQILDPALPLAMGRLLETGGFDAVVCNYYPRHVSAEGDLLGIGATIHAPGGPPQQAPSWNMFGGGLALVRRSALVSAGMIDTDSAQAETVVWEVLNKICANGGAVTSIPRTAVCKIVDDADTIDTLGDQQLHERLSRHWLSGLDFLRTTMLSAAIFEDFRKCPYTLKLMDSCNLERQFQPDAEIA